MCLTHAFYLKCIPLSLTYQTSNLTMLVSMYYVFVSLTTSSRSKMYAYSGEESGKRAKGVKKSVLRDTITFEDYVHCLEQAESCSRAMTSLRSEHHHIYGQTVEKAALSAFDSKRYILPDGVNTLPYGHRDIV